jgi:O-antigen ligase
LLVLAAFGLGVSAQGGYYLPARVAILVLVAGAVVLALWSRPRSPAEAWMALGACAALAAWAIIRAGVAGEIALAWSTVATLAVVAGALVVMARADGATREMCGAALIGLGMLVALIGWTGVVWRRQPWGEPVEGLWRAASTLTYANATAAVLAALSMLAIAYQLQRPHTALRAAPTCVLLIGLVATVSRAGLIALLVGLVMVGVLAGWRAAMMQALPPVVGAMVAFGALAPSLPATEQPKPHLAVPGLVMGVLLAVGLARMLPRRPATVAVVVGSLTAAIIWTAIEVFEPVLRTIAATRLNLDSFGRAGAARAALRMVADHPLLGVGPGRARFMWQDANGDAVVARYAHDEYLQLLVELGAIGLAIMLTLLTALILTIRRGRAGAGAALWAGSAAAFAVLLVHSAFDFLWQLPVLPLTGAVLAGLSGAGTNPPVPVRDN